ncbi:T9SS type A sorting domain-containing protein [Spirosoma taeanense]|uniref:T9SS type A sorting domain-containing protein n=1 Tax=Spirosoma taeanense TaxID=2735870 RepID=A0A6M5YGT0_9BACT|nr:T9SS type A sorting domain-containing protein [Spirosoma taeanense]QJW92112.1 T9SS type A sorting domain-containing protein [Spirosoma taeanense]
MYFRKSSARPFVAGLVLVGSLLAGSVFAQNKTASAKPNTAYAQFVRSMRTALPVPKTICYKVERDAFTRILPPDEFLKSRQNPNARRAATAKFNVTYTNFSPEAQRAFQYAVDIWSNILVSPVTINISANWTNQNRGVLGSAGPAEIRIGSDGTQKALGVYPIALAEKIARRDLNDPTDPDINADFNRNNNWYYGLDGKTPAGQTDLVTVVLHEIGHGLGFIGYFGTTGTSGQYTLNGYPAVFDHFIENGQGQRLVSATSSAGLAFPDNSNALYRQLTGGNLYLNGPILQQKTGQRAKLYAPSSFDRGSSVYHLDEETYRSTTTRVDSNSLMTPQLANAEAIHTPGPLVINFFSDIEWKTTSVLHEPLVSSEDVKDVVFRARVISDTTLRANSVRFFYRKSAPTGTDSTFLSITPTLVAGTTADYTYTMPANLAQGDVWYYFQAQDVSGRTYTNPGKSPTGVQLLHRVQFGPDTSPPSILFSPSKNFIFNPAATDSIPVYAGISDDRETGIDTAYVEYQINGQGQQAIPLRYTRQTVNGNRYDSVYTNRITFPANTLKAGDKISYRIVARDSSRARNQRVSPQTGFYEVTVVQLQATRDQYTNTFANATAASDFATYGFSITTPTGFANPAIHSEHPYRNGSDFKYQSNYETVLLAPIRIKTNPDSATIRYDEIVLVEPGEAGSRYGDDDFYDYVIVEGSRNNGQTWQPIVDGYDSNDQTDWLNAYNRNLVPGTSANDRNSATVGTPALYKRRELSITNNGFFRAGEQILIRFRLFADQLAHGWGWAIDNLQIQVPPPPPVLAVEPISAGRFSVYPNPVSTGRVRIEAELPRPVAEAALTVSSGTGQTLRQLTLKVGGSKLSEQIDLSQLPTGLYFLRLNAGDLVLTQKVIITH